MAASMDVQLRQTMAMLRLTMIEHGTAQRMLCQHTPAYDLASGQSEGCMDGHVHGIWGITLPTKNQHRSG